MNYSIVRLGELCDMDRNGLQSDDPIALNLPFVGVENVGAGTGIINFDTDSRIGSQKSTAFRFDRRHILYAKLRPYLNKVATPDFSGRCSTELIPLLPREGVEREFVAHLLRRTETVEFVMKSVTGSRMPRTDMKALMSMPVPLPPHDEQQRIVGILDRAAKIERLRARAADRLREFIPALFVRIFGDPTENPMGWERYPFTAIVKDRTKIVQKVKRRDYRESGNTPIVDQGKGLIAGYTNLNLGRYNGPFPAIVFGDHTRRFKLIRFPFFLGADGVKLLIPVGKNLDSTFLFAQMLCLNIENAGYSRHFKFLKSNYLIQPPLDRQLQFRELIESTDSIAASMESAAVISSILSDSLRSQLIVDKK